ncbi:hypothetical protein AYK26_00730 [Euryarchaeota archaeon SM23-78]|nr:MAG: hypothetical protein AYK26_00730 [Euryarchaeota archaeon SM23-78]
MSPKTWYWIFFFVCSFVGIALIIWSLVLDRKARKMSDSLPGLGLAIASILTLIFGSITYVLLKAQEEPDLFSMIKTSLIIWGVGLLIAILITVAGYSRYVDEKGRTSNLGFNVIVVLSPFFIVGVYYALWFLFSRIGMLVRKIFPGTRFFYGWFGTSVLGFIAFLLAAFFILMFIEIARDFRVENNSA